MRDGHRAHHVDSMDSTGSLAISRFLSRARQHHSRTPPRPRPTLLRRISYRPLHAALQKRQSFDQTGLHRPVHQRRSHRPPRVLRHLSAGTKTFSTTLYAARHNFEYGATTSTSFQPSPPTASSPPPLSAGIHLRITHSHSNFAYYSVNQSASRQHTYVIHASFNRPSNQLHLFVKHTELNLM